MNAYSQWNNKLATWFFNPDMEGYNVHLYVNQDLIDEISRDIPEAGSFRTAVAGQPSAPYLNGKHICKRAYHEFLGWRIRNQDIPPYVGYLCFFVLASGAEGDFAPHAYYPRLWTQLMYEGRSGPPRWFDRMRELWDDLENWSVFDRQGKLGIFQSRSIGGHVHIGYPLSQAILVEQDRQVLPRVFFKAGLDPASSHPDDEIAMALRSNIARRLMRTRTILMAENPQDELHRALIDAVNDELEAWDGTMPGSEINLGQSAQTLGGLRICIELDQVTGIAKSSIRCRLNHEFPEAGLTLDHVLHADEDVNGWSLPIKNNNTGEHFDASMLDWRISKTMRSKSPNYLLRLKGYPVRIFISGMAEGISDLVDTPTLPLGQPFYLSYPEDAWPRLQRWATTQCREFHGLDIVQGLPNSWRFASVETAIDDEAVKNEFPILTFQSGLRLLLVGGIRSGNGNNFFFFAPPSVRLIGGAPTTEVYCNQVLLSSPATAGIFTLPSDLPNGSRITIEARSDQLVLCRQSLFLTSDYSLPTGEPEIFVDSSAISSQFDSDKTSVSGAYIKGQIVETTTSAAEVFEDLEYELCRMRCFLVGQHPGQIIAWPSEPFPNDWIPTWVITKIRPKKWKAVFVSEMLGAISLGSLDTPTRRKLKDWKKVTWHWRKRILQPEQPDERSLWNQIQELSRRV